jgi:pseudouridine-5'-monophosphatase
MPASTHVIFDLDGTLLDTESLYSVAAQRVCGRYGATYSLELKRRIMGGDTLWSAQVVTSTLGLPLTPEAYVEAREAELRRLLPATQPMPGAVPLIEALRARAIPVAIATSGHRAITTLKLAHQPFLAGVTAVVCGDDPRLAHAKPAPDIFLLAARELSAPPQDCVVLEDSLNGVRAGIAAGMRTIAVVDARFGFEPDQFTGATQVVRSLADLTVSTLLGGD